MYIVRWQFNLNSDTAKNMNKFFAIAFLCVQMFAFGQAPTITSPTPEQEYYEGETVQIRWKSTRPNPWQNVNLAKMTENGVFDYIKVGAPNNGAYDWTAEQFRASERVVIEVADGGYAQNRSQVTIIVHSGPRPKTEVGQKFQLKPIVIVGLDTVPANTYRFEIRKDNGAWEVAGDLQMNSTKFYWAASYSSEKCSYRITNLTTSEEVEYVTLAGVAVEWSSTPGHTYRIKQSSDLSTWETKLEKKADSAEGVFYTFAENSMGYFAVIDLAN
jgi:hypothetical protein